MSVAQSLVVGDESTLLDPEPDLGDIKLPAIESWVAEAKAAFRAETVSSTSTDLDLNENVDRELMEETQLVTQGKLLVQMSDSFLSQK